MSYKECYRDHRCICLAVRALAGAGFLHPNRVVHWLHSLAILPLKTNQAVNIYCIMKSLRTIQWNFHELTTDNTTPRIIVLYMRLVSLMNPTGEAKGWLKSTSWKGGLKHGFLLI